MIDLRHDDFNRTGLRTGTGRTNMNFNRGPPMNEPLGRRLQPGTALVCLSPGATWSMTDNLKLDGFVQAPIHQRVNGLQPESKVSVSVGLHCDF